MSRELVADSHHGHDNQVLAAVNNLDVVQTAVFLVAFPEWPEWVEDKDSVDPEYSSWVADWIEANTDMNWDDGDLWEGYSDDLDDDDSEDPEA